MSKVFDLGFGQSDREITLESLPVQGVVPSWLTGTLLRNGPGTFQVGEQRYRHWFDGLAMLHKFSFAGGRVAYANKFLETNAYRSAQETGRITYSEFATDPCRDFFQRVMAIFSPKITDSAKVNITQIANQYLALAETPIQVQFDPETLESVGVFSYEAGTTGQMTTVHPHFDFARDTVYNVVTRYHRMSHYRLYQMIGAAAPQCVGQVPVRQPAYMHSFGMSQNYIILTEFPLVVNPLSLLLWLRPYIENFTWKPQRGTPITLLNRFTGEVVARYKTDPFFAFHHVNAFEQGDELIFDIVAYPDADILKAYYLRRLEQPQMEIPFGKLRRYRLPLKAKQQPVTWETISEQCMELPRFDYERYNNNPNYRYVYASSINPRQRQGFYNQLVKVDMATRQAQIWYEENCYPGEPVFAAAPDHTAEDDGVILSVVLNAAQGNSFLLILDAHTFDEIGRAEIPHPVLFGYHGEYFRLNVDR
ncbi:MAG: carotenoid oxygenase family protein [Anaerolineae bacterium]|nr:carotenoid oxygenase family protein [Anaerolineae bacterium]